MSDKQLMTQEEHDKEMKMVVAITRVETLQAVANESFDAHRAEDRVHFDRLYDSIEAIEKGIGQIPTMIMKHGDEIKKDTLDEARQEFNPITEFKVFQTKVTSIIVGVTIAGTLLGTLLNWVVQAGKLVN